ncbi:MAG: polyprenyl synthetase family protein [Firmicutes bacterium]|nr:polyprenyl synthetase family protein [Bacillota bacterium]
MQSEQALPQGAENRLAFLSLVESDMQEVERVLTGTLREDNPLVQSVADYLLGASGKRLRPAMVILAGQFGTHRRGLTALAAAVEMIHMATLVHDDIIDHALVRRGQPAVHVRFNEQVAVLSGDFLFARAFQLFSDSGDLRVVRAAADVVHTMCTGEIAQNLDQGRVASEEGYLQRIYAKTAAFLETACRIGALGAGASPEVGDTLAAYGYALGMAFQIVDDLLDWVADPERLGKSVGEDLQEGIFTLPVIYALNNPLSRDALLAVLGAEPGPGTTDQVRTILQSSGAIDYALEKAGDYIKEALERVAALPAGAARTALESLARFVLDRDY